MRRLDPWIVVIVVSSAVCSNSQGLVAEDVASPEVAAEETNPTSVDSVRQLITDMIRDNIPHTYEDKKKWGLTSKRWDGLDFKLEGFQLKTKRKWKEVKHGDWSMYRLSLIDPKEAFAVRVEELRDTDDGRLAFDMFFTARVHAFARVAKWVKGVQLYSFSADAHAKITLRLQGAVGMTLNLTKLPPDVALDPKVDAATLELHEFKLYRVSDVGGEVAQQLGRTVRTFLDSKIDDGNQKLPTKINKQIAKKQDRLRFSMHDLVVSKWSDLAKYVTKPTKVDQAVPVKKRHGSKTGTGSERIHENRWK